METDAAAKIISYVGEFILGGITLLAVGVAIWSIRFARSVHAAHVDDLKKTTDKILETNKAYVTSSTQTIEAMGSLKTMVQALNQTLEQNTKVSLDLRSYVESVRSTLDSIIRDAVRRRSSDRWQARPGGGSGEEGGQR